MIEAELKAAVHDPAAVMAALDKWATGVAEVYHDTYYDRPDGSLTASDYELRVRTVHGPDSTRSVLTFKEPTVDEASGSKPEYETAVEEPGSLHATLRGLGHVVHIEYEKHCRNYRFTAAGREMLATLVRVPEVDGNGVWIELETQAERSDLDAALADVRSVLGELGIGDGDLTTEKYTDSVRAARA